MKELGNLSITGMILATLEVSLITMCGRSSKIPEVYLWVGTANGGLNRFDPREGTFISFKNDPSDPTSINDNYILSIYEDRSGMMWIGTNAGGVNYYNPSSQVFNHFAQ